ncbi:hypothetical protein DFQ04_3546 [Algoriphagus boseongensis]|uniref:Oxygen tolerance protein BatD n=2 Tax=Algoriphagus boseongensis TaxID=1442587 RepID=A0A4R6T2G6_9BACT|nr:hypothetical protein DFQ04_3546 [Algoriphagus boseongensis]
MGKYLSIFFMVILTLPAFSQQVEVEGYFTQDSAKLGERVGFVLKAKYPEGSQLFFPDSAYDFSPFVLLEKKTFISSTQEGTTLDSAVYFLSNFSLEPSSYLSLPVYEVTRYDSLTYYSGEAELKLKLMLDSIPEQLVFKENNVYQPLEKSFNWLIGLLIFGAVVLFLGAFLLLFAKRIKAFLKAKREKLRWMQFERKWKKLTALLNQTPAIELADEVVGLWKGYLESITGMPFQEWTSSEIAQELGDPQILKALRSIDMIIYAGKEANTEESAQYLLQLAKTKYQEKLNQIRNERTPA